MKIKFTPSPNQLRIKHLIRNSKKQKFLCDIYISLNRTLSDRIDYPKQFRIRNPIRHSLPITPSDRIFYPKPFRIKNPIRRGFLKKTLSDRISYPKPFRIENPIRIARQMKSCIPATPWKWFRLWIHLSYMLYQSFNLLSNPSHNTSFSGTHNMSHTICRQSKQEGLVQLVKSRPI